VACRLAAAPEPGAGSNDRRVTSAADPVHGDSDPHIVLGDPGAAATLTRELADTELHAELEKRLPGARWCIEVWKGDWYNRRLPMLKSLTDLPLHVDQHPVVALANPVSNVAIVSVPALGAMGARNRSIRSVISEVPGD
jgi:hypothetical protein